MEPRSPHRDFAQNQINFSEVDGCIAMKTTAVTAGYAEPQDYCFLWVDTPTSTTANMVSLDNSAQAQKTHIGLDEFRKFWSTVILNVTNDIPVVGLPIGASGSIFKILSVRKPSGAGFAWKLKCRSASHDNASGRNVPIAEVLNRLHGPTMIKFAREIQEVSRRLNSQDHALENTRQNTGSPRNVAEANRRRDSSPRRWMRDRTRSPIREHAHTEGFTEIMHPRPETPDETVRDLARERQFDERMGPNEPRARIDTADNRDQIRAMGQNVPERRASTSPDATVSLSSYMDIPTAALVTGFWLGDGNVTNTKFNVREMSSLLAEIDLTLKFRGRVHHKGDVRDWVERLNIEIPKIWDVDKLINLPAVVQQESEIATARAHTKRINIVRKMRGVRPTLAFTVGPGVQGRTSARPINYFAAQTASHNDPANPRLNTVMQMDDGHLDEDGEDATMGDLVSAESDSEDETEEVDTRGRIRKESAHQILAGMGGDDKTPDVGGRIKVGAFEHLHKVAPKNAGLQYTMGALNCKVAGEELSAVGAMKRALKLPSTCAWGASQSLIASATEANTILGKLINRLDSAGCLPRLKKAHNTTGMLNTIAILMASLPNENPESRVDSHYTSDTKGRRDMQIVMDDDMKGVQGTADVSAQVLRALQRSNHIKKWADSVGTSNREPLPACAILFNASDPVSRASKGELIPLEVKTALDSDHIERSNRVEQALERRLGKFMNPKMLKTMKVNIMALRFTRLPALCQIATLQTETDTFGNKRPTRKISVTGAASLIYDIACAAFPEWSWQALRTLASEINRLLEVDTTSMQLRAGSIWEEAMRRAQLECDRVRMGDVGTSNGEIFEGGTFEAWVMNESKMADKGAADNDSAQAPLLARINALEKLLPQSSPKPHTAKGTPSQGGGLCYGVTFKTALPNWVSKFGKKCIHFNLMNKCEPPNGTTCPNEHVLVPIEDRKKFVADEGGKWKDE